MKKFLSLLLVFSVMQAFAECGSGGCGSKKCYSGGCETSESCFSDCAPLRCGGFGVQVKGGVAPGFYTARGPITGVVGTPCPLVDQTTTELNCSTKVGEFNPIASIRPKMPKQSDFRSLPWIVGAELTYNTSANTQLFLEIFHRQAGPKTFCFPDDTGIFRLVKEVTNKLRHTGASFGCRHYTNRMWCETTSFFFGIKGGFLHRGDETCFPFVTPKVKFWNIDAGTAITTKPDVWAYFKQDNTIITGFNLGLDFKVWNCLSIVLTGELVASGAYRTDVGTNLLPLGNQAKGAAVSYNYAFTGVELFFPVTLGLTFSF